MSDNSYLSLNGLKTLVNNVKSYTDDSANEVLKTAKDYTDEEIAKGGVDGKSAYEIWLEQGNTGTEEDFLASLKGDKPVKGEDYFTEEDKAELVTDVLEALPTWEGGSF